MAKLGEYGDKLKDMTAQEVFNVGCDHLLSQGKKSLSEDGNVCAYKGDGVCCAAAPFIQNYNSHTMENVSWEQLVFENNQEKNHKNIIENLQRIHDSKPAPVWPSRLKDLAIRFGLVHTELLNEFLMKEEQSHE